MKLTFITGNANKARLVAAWLQHDIPHQKLDLDEIQSSDVRTVTGHKAKQAYESIKTPVLVEDCALVFHAIAPMPGPFIKWFEDEVGNEKICRMLDGFEDRSASARLNYCLHDGQEAHFFEGEMHGKIADHPRGDGGFGFDTIFINEGYEITRAEMNEADYKTTSYRRKGLDALAEFLRSTDHV